MTYFPEDINATNFIGEFGLVFNEYLKEHNLLHRKQEMVPFIAGYMAKNPTKDILQVVELGVFGFLANEIAEQGGSQ